MFVIYYSATNPGLPKTYAVSMDEIVDVLSCVDRYATLAYNDSVWVPPCCWADHE